VAVVAGVLDHYECAVDVAGFVEGAGGEGNHCSGRLSVDKLIMALAS
jgi:hypothetical protein